MSRKDRWSGRREGMRLLHEYEWWMGDGHLEKSGRQSGKTLMMSTPTRGKSQKEARRARARTMHPAPKDSKGLPSAAAK